MTSQPSDSASAGAEPSSTTQSGTTGGTAYGVDNTGSVHYVVSGSVADEIRRLLNEAQNLCERHTAATGHALPPPREGTLLRLRLESMYTPDLLAYRNRIRAARQFYERRQQEANTAHLPYVETEIIPDDNN